MKDQGRDGRRDVMVKLNESMLSILDGMEEAEARRKKLLNASAMNVNTQTKLPTDLNSAHCEVLVRQALDKYSESARSGSTTRSLILALKLQECVEDLVRTVAKELEQSIGA